MNPKPYICAPYITLWKYRYMVWQSVFGFRDVLEYEVCTSLSIGVAGILIYEAKYWKLSVQSLSGVRLFATPWTAARKGSLAGCSPLETMIISKNFFLARVCISKWLGGFEGKKKKTLLPIRRCGFDPWVGTIPWRRKWQPTSVFLPGESHGQRSLVAGYSPWGHTKSDTV